MVPIIRPTFLPLIIRREPIISREILPPPPLPPLSTPAPPPDSSPAPPPPFTPAPRGNGEPPLSSVPDLISRPPLLQTLAPTISEATFQQSLLPEFRFGAPEDLRQALIVTRQLEPQRLQPLVQPTVEAVEEPTTITGRLEEFVTEKETRALREQITPIERAGLFGAAVGLGLARFPSRIVGLGRGLVTEPVQTITGIPGGFVEFGREVGGQLAGPTPEVGFGTLVSEGLIFRGTGRVAGAARRGAARQRVALREFALDIPEFDISRAPFTKTPFATTFPTGLDIRGLEFRTPPRQQLALKRFQAERPRRLEVLPDIEQIKIDLPVRFDVLDVVPRKPRRPRKVQPLEVSIDPELLRRLRSETQRFDILDVRPPKKLRPLTVFDIVERPKKKVKKVKKPKRIRTLLDFETPSAEEFGVGVTQRGRQQLILERPIQRQLITERQIRPELPQVGQRQIQAQRIQFAPELKQLTTQIPRGGLRLDLRFASLLRQETRQAQAQAFAQAFPQPQIPRFAQPQAQAFAQAFAQPQLFRERGIIIPRLDLGLEPLAPRKPPRVDRAKRKKPKVKRKAKRARVRIAPSFTGIVLGIEKAAKISPTFGVLPGQIRGLRTGF